jgi:orotate phosphoribosyltransferase-like protein
MKKSEELVIQIQEILDTSMMDTEQIAEELNCSQELVNQVVEHYFSVVCPERENATSAGEWANRMGLPY